jgi:hypothetical protein
MNHQSGEMLRHCAAIVRNQNASLSSGSRQDFRILKTAQTCLGSGLEINRALVSPHRPHDVLIEIGIRLKSDFRR